jgi:hypothetical protein
VRKQHAPLTNPWDIVPSVRGSKELVAVCKENSDEWSV